MPVFDAYMYVTTRIKTTRFEARNPKEAADRVWEGISVSQAVNRIYTPTVSVDALQAIWYSADGVKIEVHPVASLDAEPMDGSEVRVFINSEDETLQLATDFDKVALRIRSGSIVQAMSLCPGVKEVVVINEDAIPEVAAEVKMGAINLDLLNNRMKIQRVSPSVANVDYKAKVLQYLGWTEQVTPKKVNTMPVELAGEQEWWPDMATTLPRGPKQPSEHERAKGEEPWIKASDPARAWQEELKAGWKRHQSRTL